jgi:hypothetical protein
MFAILLLLLLMAWRVVAIDHTFMRDDEEIAFRTTNQDLGYTLRYQAEQDIQAPLWFAAFWFWRQVAGSTEFAARILSILFTMLTFSMVYRIGRDWFRASRYGLAAMAVLGVNVYFFINSMEIRPCAMMPRRRSDVVFLALAAKTHIPRRAALQPDHCAGVVRPLPSA